MSQTNLFSWLFLKQTNVFHQVENLIWRCHVPDVVSVEVLKGTFGRNTWSRLSCNVPIVTKCTTRKVKLRGFFGYDDVVFMTVNSLLDWENECLTLKIHFEIFAAYCLQLWWFKTVIFLTSFIRQSRRTH